MSQLKKRTDIVGKTARPAGARSPSERLEPGRAPSRPRGFQDSEPSRVMGRIVRIVSGLMTIALVSMLFIGGAAFAIFHQYQSPGPLSATKTVVIPKGEGRIAIAERLEKAGVITNRWTFVGGHLLQSFFGDRKALELKAGEYEIKDHASMRDVIETLADGKSILYKATLPEGLTSEQIVERLKADASLTGDIPTIPDEGTLLPDTYYFSKGAARSEIVDRMKGDMQKAIDILWNQRDPDIPLRTPGELITFASIVEKETGRPDERDRVAAVFYNRLKKGMRLQSDPTIIYGIVGGQGTLGRGITRSDIDTKSPYNTYQINGLPPGPICNPGKSALLAALHPAKTADLYFVADGTGGHTFSETLKDHNAAVQKWRASEKQAKATQGTPDDTANDAAPIPAGPDDNANKAKPAPQKTSKTAKAVGADTGASNGEATETGTDIPLPVRKPKKQ